MSQIIEYVEAHYETHEVPFGRIYEWHAEHISIECDCGERFALSATTTTTCRRCGTDHSAIIGDIQKREGRLPDKSTHPWLHDNQEQAQQQKHDESTYPKGSPWRYNDITAGPANGA